MLKFVEEYIKKNFRNLILKHPIYKFKNFKFNNAHFLKVRSRPSYNGNVIFLVFINDLEIPFFLLKIPRNPDYTENIEREYHNLSYLYDKLQGTHIQNSIPIPLGLINYESTIFLLESAHHGNKVRNYHTNFKTLLNSTFVSVEWLINCHLSTLSERKLVSKEHIDNILKQKYEKLIKRFDLTISDKKNIRESFSNISKEVAGSVIPFVFQHGDFSLHNTLLKKDNTLQVFDWEDSLINSLPFNDLFHLLFILLSTISERDYSYDNAFKVLISRNKYSRFTNLMIFKYCRALEIDESIFKQFFLYYLVNQCIRDTEIYVDKPESSFRWLENIREYMKYRDDFFK